MPHLPRAPGSSHPARLRASIALFGLLAACASSSAPGDDDDDGIAFDGGPDDPARDGGIALGEDAGTRRDGGPTERDGGEPDAGALCPAPTCEDVTVAALSTTLPACCPGGGADCGYDLRGVAATLGLVEGEVECVATAQPGRTTSDCPSRTVLGAVTLPGCCRPEGECGFLANLSMFGVPNFGCVPTESFSGTSAPASCTP